MLIAINTVRSSQIGGGNVDLLLNSARFRTINKAIEAKYFQKFNFTRSRIAIRLENDQLTYHDVLASDVFADRLPIVGLRSFGLKPGAILKLNFLMSNGSSFPFIVVSRYSSWFSVSNLNQNGLSVGLWHNVQLPIGR